MSTFHPQTTKTGGMPKFSYIFCKPENLGMEFKTAVCPVKGVMTYMEIQSGKVHMNYSKYFSELGATATCALRAAENASHETEGKSKELVKSWF